MTEDVEAHSDLHGHLINRGRKQEVTLTDNGIVIENKDAGGTETNIPWSDIFNVESCGGGNTKLSIDYISRNKKDFNWQATRQEIDVVHPERVAQWTVIIKDQYRPHTPKKVLVLINPVSGKRKGRNVWETLVSKLFITAGIASDVLYTERPKHIVDILKTYDISSVDSIITMGGDGTYFEVVDTFMQRMQKEAGIDTSDVNHNLVPVKLRFGLIPIGTANIVSRWACHVPDNETAALHIIKGETNLYNVYSVHDAGSLVGYAGLCFGYGFSCDLMTQTVETRWMRVFRYPYAVGKLLFGRKREYDAEIEYKDTTDSSSDAEWKKVEVSEYMDMISYVAGMDDLGSRLALNPTSDGTSVICLKKTTGYRYIKTLYDLLLHGKKETLEAPFVKHFLVNVTALKVKAKPRENALDRDLELECLISIDGETHKLSRSEFEIRLHKHVIPIFSSPWKSFYENTSGKH